MPDSNLNRRGFLGGVSAAALATSSGVLFAEGSPNETINVAVMGTSIQPSGSAGRGTHLGTVFAKQPNCRVVAICDADARNTGPAADKIVSAASGQATRPRVVNDYRELMDDPSIDAIVIATPDHWHAPAAIEACQAGKHVYVEKPCCHNPHEGEMLIEASKRANRLVQVGTQRRSRPGIQEAVQKLHEGLIGDVLYARCHYYNARPSIGTGKQVAPPSELNWEMWQGPAPKMAFHDNYVHYNWHWFWHWGTGELGNNAVHFLDVLRWGMQVEFPTSVTCTGANLLHDDDQQTPDTSQATFNFNGGKKQIVWEQRSWTRKSAFDPSSSMSFFGSKGALEITKESGYRAIDSKGKEIAEGSGASGETDHINNFLSSIRGDATLNCDIETGYRSTLFCLLANISYRTGKTISLDPETHQLANEPQAMKDYWKREYDPKYEPKLA